MNSKDKSLTQFPDLSNKKILWHRVLGIISEGTRYKLVLTSGDFSYLHPQTTTWIKFKTNYASTGKFLQQMKEAGWTDEVYFEYRTSGDSIYDDNFRVFGYYSLTQNGNGQQLYIGEIKTAENAGYSSSKQRSTISKKIDVVALFVPNS